MAKISKALQDTVASSPNIKEVYFDASDNWYFISYRLPRFKGDTEPQKLYGQGEFSHKQVIPGKFNVDNLTEDVSKAEIRTEIVEIISREDILSANTEENKQDIVSIVRDLSEEDRALLRTLLAPVEKTPPPSVKAPVKIPAQKQDDEDDE